MEQDIMEKFVATSVLDEACLLGQMVLIMMESLLTINDIEKVFKNGPMVVGMKANLLMTVDMVMVSTLGRLASCMLVASTRTVGMVMVYTHGQTVVSMQGHFTLTRKKAMGHSPLQMAANLRACIRAMSGRDQVLPLILMASVMLDCGTVNTLSRCASLPVVQIFPLKLMVMNHDPMSIA